MSQCRCWVCHLNNTFSLGFSFALLYSSERCGRIFHKCVVQGLYFPKQSTVCSSILFWRPLFMESPPHTPRNHKKLLFTINFPNASFKRRISFSNIEFSIVFNIIFYCCIILKIILKFFFSSCLSHIAWRLFGEDLFVFWTQIDMSNDLIIKF